MNSNFLDMMMKGVQSKSSPWYVIKMQHGDKDWYFFDLRMKVIPHPALWTTRLELAYGFSSEQEVDEFISDFLVHRTVQILKIT